MGVVVVPASLIDELSNHYDFMKKTTLVKDREDKGDGLFEKNEIKWFSLEDLKQERNKFRLFYRPIVDILIHENETLLVKTKQLKSK